LSQSIEPHSCFVRLQFGIKLRAELAIQVRAVLHRDFRHSLVILNHAFRATLRSGTLQFSDVLPFVPQNQDGEHSNEKCGIQINDGRFASTSCGSFLTDNFAADSGLFSDVVLGARY
jgi:hypothetical protein